MTTHRANAEVSQNKIRGYRDLIVWQKGMSLVEETYSLARILPGSERFILRDQMLRAAISVPSNIAEGHGHWAKGSFVRHLGDARGSLHELETQFEIARRVGYFDDSALVNVNLLSDEVGRMTWSLMEKLGTRHWR